MVSLTDDFRFKPQEDITMEMLSLKTNVADAAIGCTNLAMEAVGGQGFYRKNELERLFRDVNASQFHPLPKWDQYAFTGKRLVEAEA
jgi:alkylation response protein AidB-like acyl-CoA dehydrogenase